MINHDIAKLHLHKEFEIKFYYGIVFSADDKLMAAYGDYDVYFCDITLNWNIRHYQEKIDGQADNDDREIQEEKENRFEKISAIQFSLNGSQIAVGLYSQKINIRDVHTYELLKTFNLDHRIPQRDNIKKIFFEGDIIKIATNLCYTQQFSMTSDDDMQISTRGNLLYANYQNDLIFEAKSSRVLVNETLLSIRENGQIIHKTLFKQKHRGITQTKQNQIYCLDSDKLYIIHRSGRIIRKAKQEQGVYRYAASQRFIAYLNVKLLNLYDLSTGAIIHFKNEQLISVIGLNSNFMVVGNWPNFVVVGNWPMRVYDLPNDLSIFIHQKPKDKQTFLKQQRIHKH